MKKVKIGMISFEHSHAYSYAAGLQAIEGVEIVGIYDNDTYRGYEAAATFKTKFFENHHDLLATDIDGVVICSCNRDHEKYVVDAANAKKHIVVEKPFSITEESAKNMIEVCKKNNVKIMTAFPKRFDQSAIEAKIAIDNGEIGEILAITGVNHGKMPGGWFINKEKAGGGAVMDHTVHVADLIRWITGSEAKKVYAESGPLIHNIGIDDCGLLTVELENGVVATIDTSWAHHKTYPVWPDVYLEFVGTKGVLTVDCYKQGNRYYTDSGVADHLWGDLGDEGLMAEFVDVIRTGKEPNSTGVDGVKAMEIAIAAYKSSESHLPVDIVDALA